MKLDELQQLWNSNANRPNPGENAQVVQRFGAALRRRRRREAVWLVWTFCVLSVLTAFAAWVVFGTDKVRLREEWAIVPLLLIPWVLACVFLRRFLQGKTAKHRGDVTISDSLAAAMTANRSERFKLKAFGVMYLLVLPLLALSAWQLQAAGKISARELVCMAGFLIGALGLSGGAVLARYWIGVVPERRKLEALLAQCREMA